MKATIEVDSKIAQTINDFSDGTVFKRVCDELRLLAGQAYRHLVLISPVDKGIFKTNWIPPVEALTENSITLSITNDTPYGIAIDEGSKLGSRPWPNPGPKTVLNKGRVFSTQAPEGAISPTIIELGLEEKILSKAYKIIIEKLG